MSVSACESELCSFNISKKRIKKWKQRYKRERMIWFVIFNEKEFWNIWKHFGFIDPVTDIIGRFASWLGVYLRLATFRVIFLSSSGKVDWHNQKNFMMRNVSLETLPNVNIRDPSHNENLPIITLDTFKKTLMSLLIKYYCYVLSIWKYKFPVIIMFN